MPEIYRKGIFYFIEGFIFRGILTAHVISEYVLMIFRSQRLSVSLDPRRNGCPCICEPHHMKPFSILFQRHGPHAADDSRL